MDIKNVPNWILSLSEEDMEFIKIFAMNSGSLKKRNCEDLWGHLSNS